jgi:hypothetical protein
MSDNEDIKSILTEILDNQRRALELHEAQLAIARDQLERSRQQIGESLALQREAIAKQRTVMRIAVPGIALCIAAILYLILRYF